MTLNSDAPGSAGRNPRLLVLVNYYPPDRTGGAGVFGDMCAALADRGFEVTVRCAYPFYPEWRDKSGRNGLRVWRYRERGVEVERYGLFIPRNPNSLLQRLVHEASLLLSYARSVPRSGRFDVIMAVCPTISTVAIGVMVKLLFRKPMWLNVQDLAAEAASGVGLVNAGWLMSSFLALQRWLFNRADTWSTISPVMLEKIAPRRRRDQPMLLLPNWIDLPMSTEIERMRQASAPRPPQTPLRLLYSGNLGMKQNLLQLLQALQRSDAAFEFRIHGDGAQGANIRRWIEQAGDARFSMGPLLEAGDFARTLLDAHYYVISERADAGASFMPSKLVVGISAGIPLLTICDPDSPLGEEVREAGLGPWFSWDRLPEVAGFIAGRAHDAAQHRAWSDNGRRRAGAFDREAIIGHFAQELRRMLVREAQNR